MAYRADIDGLRAVAVIAVLLFHAGLGLPGGFVGVDIFFVISGFLITSIVMREVKSGEFSYLGFWERRIRRLVPAMIVMIAATVVAGYVILLPHDLKELGQSVCAQTVAVANFYFYRESGYFAGTSEIKPLLHTWSLAVEEQFYLVMPAMLLLFNRIWPNRIRTALVVVLLISLGWCAYSTSIYPDAAFYLLPTRSWELLLGSLVALSGNFRALKRGQAEALSLFGLAAIVGAIVVYTDSTPFPGTFALLPCLGTAAIIIGNSAHLTIAGRLLSWRPVVFVGLISYSLYLWHWPLFAFANYMTPGHLPNGLSACLIFASLLLGFFSWRFVETPFRCKSLLPTRRRVLASAATSLIAMGCIGFVLHKTDGVRSRFTVTALKMTDARSDKNPMRRMHHDLPAKALRKAPVLLAGGQNGQPRLVVLGDSHADALMPGISSLCDKHGVPMVAFTRSDTLPFVFSDAPRDRSEETFFAAAAAYLQQSPAQNVFIVARWGEYKNRLSATELAKTVNGLRAIGKRVWVLRHVPEPRADVPRFLALSEQWNWNDSFLRRSKTEYLSAQLEFEELLDSIGCDIQVVDISDRFFDGSDLAIVHIEYAPLYFDDNHLSTVGATVAAAPLEPIIAAMAQDAS